MSRGGTHCKGIKQSKTELRTDGAVKLGRLIKSISLIPGETDVVTGGFNLTNQCSDFKNTLFLCFGDNIILLCMFLNRSIIPPFVQTLCALSILIMLNILSGDTLFLLELKRFKLRNRKHVFFLNKSLERKKALRAENAQTS